MKAIKKSERIRSTTVILVRRGDDVAIAGDGQVTLGETIMKGSAKKVRRLAGGSVIAGFANHGLTYRAINLLIA